MIVTERAILCDSCGLRLPLGPGLVEVPDGWQQELAKMEPPSSPWWFRFMHRCPDCQKKKP